LWVRPEESPDSEPDQGARPPIPETVGLEPL
jgi:hypothetical protein